MTVYEYPTYQADADLCKSLITRIDRVQAMIKEYTEKLDNIEIHFEGGDGDIALSVNHEGQLTSLTLADGVTTRYTNVTFQDLFNTTLLAAVDAATTEADSLTGAEDQEQLNAALEALADPDSHLWSDTE